MQVIPAIDVEQGRIDLSDNPVTKDSGLADELRAKGLTIQILEADGSPVKSFGPSRNLAVDPRCTVTNVDATRPVSVQGMAELVTDAEAIEAYTAVTNEKYSVDYAVDFYTENALYAVRPTVVIALREDDFTGSPTRWTF
jgi:hypothetical protein